MWKKFLLLWLLLPALLTGCREKAMETAAWGLCFPQNGQPPTGPSTREQLLPYDAAFMGDPQEKTLYLTFDTGYEKGLTNGILNTLKAHRVPAAFFVTGDYVRSQPELVRRMVREGHTVGNHAMHHRDITALTDPKVLARELLELEALLRQVTGQEPEKFFRPPQGLYNRRTLELTRELGYRTVFWSLTYVDWGTQPTRSEALCRLLPRTHSGAVILLHSTSSASADILDTLLTRWTRAGYRFGTLQELFSESGSSRDFPKLSTGRG